MHIYHIVLPEVWNDLSPEAAYIASSLATEGFIHCSYAHQIDGVLKRYYADAEQVIILDIDPARLSSPLVEEPSTNNEIYPHIYGPIDPEAIIDTETRYL